MIGFKEYCKLLELASSVGTKEQLMAAIISSDQTDFRVIYSPADGSITVLLTGAA